MQLLPQQAAQVDEHPADAGVVELAGDRGVDGDVLILHPGPMNRGVEIDSDVADGPFSVILNQVTNGVAVRMAVLYLLSGGKPELAEAAKGGGGSSR